MLDSSSSTETQLKEWAKKLNVVLRGVYSKDELPKLHTGGYIVNMQNSTDGFGTHWVGIYLCPCAHSAPIYFDSYGQVPPLEIEQRLGKNYLYNNRQIQNLYSGYCGQYCLFFLWCMQNIKGTPKQRLKAFQKLWDFPTKNLTLLRRYLS